MFICENCKRQIQPGVSPTTVVVKTRRKIYPPRPHVDDPGGKGYETVKEIKICQDCENIL